MFISATGQVTEPSVFVQWVPLIVAIIGAVAAISVSLWNTRGESSALRRLKMMNDILAGLPDGEQGTNAFAAARDELAARITSRLTGPSLWRKVGSWALGVLIGVAIVGVSWWASTLIAPSQSGPPSDLFVGLSTALGAVAATAVAASASRWRSARADALLASAKGRGKAARRQKG